MTQWLNSTPSDRSRSPTRAPSRRRLARDPLHFADECLAATDARPVLRGHQAWELSRASEGGLDLGRQQVEIELVGLARIDRMKPESLPPRPSSLAAERLRRARRPNHPEPQGRKPGKREKKREAPDPATPPRCQSAPLTDPTDLSGGSR